MIFEQLAKLLGAPWSILAARKERRRQEISQLPFPDEWRSIITRNVLLYSRLPPDLRAQLHGHIQIFLAEKRFEGCAGLVITEEIKLTIAAQACLLLLNRPVTYYPTTSVILVYPSSFVVEREGNIGPARFIDKVPVAGLAWSKDYVILSWDDVVRGAADIKDGHNVVLHEFAHQLDIEDGTFNGAPILGQRSAYVSWARVLRREFENVRGSLNEGHKTIFDEYGAENPAEFFAVATETYFEKALQLKTKHPELYEELRRFYRVDPASWD